MAWNAAIAGLKVKGTGVADHVVTLYNADTGALLDVVSVNESGKWCLRYKNPVSTPLRLLAKSGSETIFSERAKLPIVSN